MGYRIGAGDRLAAAGALLAGLAAIGLGLLFAAERLPRGLVVLALLAAVVSLAWYGLVGAGPARIAGFAGAALCLAVTLAFVVRGESETARAIGTILLAGVAVLAARRAFKVRVPLPGVAAPRRPVLIYNPKSGGGKAERLGLAEEARSRGIEPVELTPEADLEGLARAAVADGADALAMAGGDGSQAVVAAIAAELDLPYACVPAGTRNHFALDLGVDRDDVVGALDALVDGGERRVDLGEVNGRTFVNNVSLGFYAEAVRRDGYREAKLKTLLQVIPEVMGPDADGPDLSWHSPSGRRHSSGAAILVSNNQYRLGKAVGSGTRPKIDDGLLGIAVLAEPTTAGGRLRRFQKPWRDWSAPGFTVDSGGPVAAGIDGESTELEPPLEFRIRPGALRVRIAAGHPGASPSAAIPDGAGKVIRSLARIAAGRSPVGRAPVPPRPDRPGPGPGGGSA